MLCNYVIVNEKLKLTHISNIHLNIAFIKAHPNGFGSPQRPLIRCRKSYYKLHTAVVTRKHIDQFVYGEQAVSMHKKMQCENTYRHVPVKLIP